MICNKCGMNNTDNAKFCVNCGSELEKRIETSVRFCEMCGKKLSPGVKFCENCGAIVNSKQKEVQIQLPDKAGELMSEAANVAKKAFEGGKKGLQNVQQQFSDITLQHSQPEQQHDIPKPVSMHKDPLARVPYKANGATVDFYEDCLAFEGKVLLYKDIKTVASEGSTTSGYAAIVVYSYSTSKIVFVMRDGTKHKLGMVGFNLYGLGTTKSATERWRELSRAVEKYVAKPMAEEIIRRIEIGGISEISCFNITGDKIIAKPHFFSNEVIITNENYGRCYSTGLTIVVEDKHGKKLVKISDDVPNAMLLPYVLPRIFKR